MLQCSSYCFNGAETNPSGWKSGIAYRFSVDDGYPRAWADCKKSNGICGHTGQYNSFTRNSGNGMNTSTNYCVASASWSRGSRTVPLWTLKNIIQPDSFH